MVAVLLLFIPLLTGLIGFAIKGENNAKNWALLSSIVTLFFAFSSISFWGDATHTNFSHTWLGGMGANFSLNLDGLSKMLCLLTAISFPVIFVATSSNHYNKPNSFYALMLLTQAGLMGVFLATDALLFYFFWELALIPAYFLCSIWGGEKRIAATFKFFVYTFVGSLLMLVGILYIYFQTPDQSFAWQSFVNVQLTNGQQGWLFWLFFIAFAIKMPIFPFHTWQPDAYEQAPTATTMVLSGVMVKMGLFAAIRWLLPILPQGVMRYDDIVIILSIIGIIYASLIAMRQDDIKRLIAYSSIAHIGLMSAAIFINNQSGVQGAMVQMFNHGINVIGLWIVADLIEKQLGTRKISELGGMAAKAPRLTILLVVVAFANIALPLTNAFVGEFMMFNGLFQQNMWFAIIAGVSVILAAVYTLRMIQNVFLGESNALTVNVKDIEWNQSLALIIIVVGIFLLGLFPNGMIQLTKESVVTCLQAMSGQ
jgi:NADH-quinone oxidoreductase subunit M